MRVKITVSIDAKTAQLLSNYLDRHYGKGHRGLSEFVSYAIENLLEEEQGKRMEKAK